MTIDSLTIKLHSTTDARVWAEEFCKLYRVQRQWAMVGDRLTDDDQFDLMVTWFANALEIGKNAGRPISGEL